MRKSMIYNNFIPDKIFTHVSAIRPEWLRAMGIGGLAVDLDNTLAGYRDTRPTQDVIEWLSLMVHSGFGVVVISNNAQERVRLFCQGLPIGYVHRAHKPLPTGYKRAVALLNLPPQAVAEVGDQIYTDVWGAKRCGLFSILVTPLHLRGHFFLRLRNLLEQPFIREALRRENRVPSVTGAKG